MNAVLLVREISTGRFLELIQGDITTESVDAIVNAANKWLMHGGGVAGAIVKRGGQIIQEQSNAWVRQNGLVMHDRPVHTSAGSLPCRYVIHAVGPVWGDGDEDNKLGAAVTGSLRLADRLGLASIAMPAISTGIFNFPKERAAGVIFQSISTYFCDYPESGVQRIRIILQDNPTISAFQSAWKQFWNQAESTH